jgi:hypothetical protein
MTDIRYVHRLEDFIIRLLRRWRGIPMYLVFRAFDIDLPIGLSSEDITLEAYIKRSLPVS